MDETIQSWLSKLENIKMKTAVLAPALMVLLFGISLLLLNGATFAQEEPIRFEAYLALIGQMRGEALNAQSQQGENCNVRLESLAAQLNQITQIRMPDGSIMQVDHAQAGLPFTFPYCNPVNFVRFLNGICPEEVCLTSGIVLPQPNESQTNGNNEDVTIVDLVDFTNSELLGVLPTVQPPDSLTEAVEGLPVESLVDEEGTSDVATGEGAISEGTVGEGTVGEGTVSEGAISEGATDEGGTVGDGTTGAGEIGDEATSEGALSEGSTGESVNGDQGTSEGATSLVSAVEEVTNDETTDENTLGEGVINNRKALPNWAILLLSLLFVAITVLIVIFLRQSQKPAPLRPETQKKVEENVQTGRQLLSKGEYREAIHKLFNATLEILEDRGLIRFESFRTNYELLGSASTAPMLVSYLSPVVDTYDRVWYGFEPLETAEFEALVDQIEELMRLKRHAPASLNHGL